MKKNWLDIPQKKWLSTSKETGEIWNGAGKKIELKFIHKLESWRHESESRLYRWCKNITMTNRIKCPSSFQVHLLIILYFDFVYLLSKKNNNKKLQKIKRTTLSSEQQQNLQKEKLSLLIQYVYHMNLNIVQLSFHYNIQINTIVSFKYALRTLWRGKTMYDIQMRGISLQQGNVPTLFFRKDEETRATKWKRRTKKKKKRTYKKREIEHEWKKDDWM